MISNTIRALLFHFSGSMNPLFISNREKITFTFYLSLDGCNSVRGIIINTPFIFLNVTRMVNRKIYLIF